MKVTIIFDSNTGNTKQIASCIQETCQEQNIELIESIDDADLIFLGTWIDKGNCSHKIQEILKSLKNKKIAFFATAGFGGSQEYYDKLAARFDTTVDSSNQILGHFFCQGKMPLATRERYVKMIQEHPEDKRLQVSLDNFDAALSHPDQSDLNNAKKYALDILKQVNTN